MKISSKIEEVEVKKVGQKLKIKKFFKLNQQLVFQLSTGDYYIKTDYHDIGNICKNEKVELFLTKNKQALFFKRINKSSFIQKIEVTESKIIGIFNGFEKGKLFELENGQYWRQTNPYYGDQKFSSGRVKIINNSIMLVDKWDFIAEVQLLTYQS